MSARGLGDLSMLELFKLETETQAATLTQALLALEREPAAAAELEICMRAAHSLKGAARIVGVAGAVTLAHAMEDLFVAVQQAQLTLDRNRIDTLLQSVDLLSQIAKTPEAELEPWRDPAHPQTGALVEALGKASASGGRDLPAAAAAGAPAPEIGVEDIAAADETERVVRVTAARLKRLLGLAGESVVESRRMAPMVASLRRLKRLHERAALAAGNVAQTRQLLAECQHLVAERMLEMQMFEQRMADHSRRLHDEALAMRMRPFGDATGGFPRLVRDVAHTLGKAVRLEIAGNRTPVDRDILERLDAPLGHLLRNAVDHGIEHEAARLAAGKPAEGVVRINARHSAGMLRITVSDDGAGIDLSKIRAAVVARRLADAESATRLSEGELLEFLFLPGFTLREAVTHISGRGVGLDAVRAMVRAVGGSIRVRAEPGRGTRFTILLPLTLSVVRALLVRIAGEPYAFPLTHIVGALEIPPERIESIEGRKLFMHRGQALGLMPATEIFGGDPPDASGPLAVVIVGEGAKTYGLVVERFLGERELVVQPLDPRLGKVKDIAAGALMEDGSPALIVDVEDLALSVEKRVAGGPVGTAVSGDAGGPPARKRVLVVDDSLTVRELERKVLDTAGYEVEIAVDGMDGWNMARTGHFDLVITDVDMPRLDGVELVTLIKKDARLRSVPVIIVSYKERPEDRRRGLDAGADYYLGKGGFQEDSLLRAVGDLIGSAER